MSLHLKASVQMEIMEYYTLQYDSWGNNGGQTCMDPKSSWSCHSVGVFTRTFHWTFILVRQTYCTTQQACLATQLHLCVKLAILLLLFIQVCHARNSYSICNHGWSLFFLVWRWKERMTLPPRASSQQHFSQLLLHNIWQKQTAIVNMSSLFVELWLHGFLCLRVEF